MKVEVEDTWKQVEWQCRTFSVAHGGFWQNHETSHGDWKVYQILVADLLVWFLLNLSWFYWILLLGSDKSILSCRLLKVDLWSPFQPLSQGHSMQWCPGQCSDAFVWWVSMRLSFKMFRVYNHTSPVMSIDLIYLFPDNCREHGRQSEWMVFAQQPQGLGSEGFKAPRYLWHHNTSLFRNQLLGHKPCEELFMSKQERFGLAHSQRFCTCNEWLRLDLYFVVRFVNCETGCTCSVGLGPTQLVAKLATKARARNHADFVACFEILNADFGSTEFQLKASFNYWRRASQTGCVESWMKRHEQCCVNACWGSAECWKWLQYVETWRQTFLIWCFASCTPVTTYKRQRAGTIYIYMIYCVRSRSSLRTSLWKTCHRLCFHVMCQSSWLAASPSTPMYSILLLFGSSNQSLSAMRHGKIHLQNMSDQWWLSEIFHSIPTKKAVVGCDSFLFFLDL